MTSRRVVLALGMLGSLAASGASALAQDVKIAVLAAQTGPLAAYGVPAVNAFKLAFDDLMAQKFFGNLKVSVTYDDYRSDKHEAIALVTRYATRDNATVIIGPTGSAELFAAGPVANENKIVMFNQGASQDLLKLGPWIFKSPESPKAYFEALSKYVTEKVKPKSCFFVSIRDSDAYIQQKNELMSQLKAGGISIVGDDYVLIADSDFTALATKIAASNADCLYVSAPPELSANVTIQAKQAGFPMNGTILGDPTATAAAYPRAGGKAVEGAIAAAWFDPEGVNEFSKAFIANYTKRYGIPPDTFAAQAYSVMMVVARAIKNAGPAPTRESIRVALTATKNVPVVVGTGTFSLEADRSPVYQSIFLKIKDGKWSRP